jgi:hypothetical protein
MSIIILEENILTLLEILIIIERDTKFNSLFVQ